MNANDNFNRANETPLASPWATSYGGGMNLVNNAARSVVDEDRGSFYTGTWGADQQSEATVGNLVNSTNYAGVLVRADGAGNAFQVITDGASGAGHTEFARWDAGVYTTLGGIATTFVNGDRLRLHVSGTSPNITLTCYKNGAQVAQLTGVTGPNSGNPGVGCYGTATVDDWSASDELGGGTVIDDQSANANAIAGIWTPRRQISVW